MTVWIVLAVLVVVAVAWVSRDLAPGRRSVEWAGIGLLLAILVAGGFLGRQVGRMYGSYRYREAQEREGLIGNLALAVTNQEQKLRVEWGGNGATWGVILVMLAYCCASSSTSSGSTAKRGRSAGSPASDRTSPN